MKRIIPIVAIGVMALLCAGCPESPPVTSAYMVTYDGNGSTGGEVPADGTVYMEGASVTVLGNPGSLVKTGYGFADWNTASDGSGTGYAEGGTFVMGTEDMTLYAMWTTSPVGVTGVTLDKTALSMTAGDTEQLTATVSPADAENKNVTWKSGDEEKATVSDGGLVTALKGGTVTITATTQDGGHSAGCEVTVKDTFASADKPGDTVEVAVGTETFSMIYANDQSSITFPTGVDDSGTATLTQKFFMAETETTNALFAEVLQWARDNDKISESGTDNLVSAVTVEYGNQELIDLDLGAAMKISYDVVTDKFSVAAGYENYPVNGVSWYGAVMFCNWLTEMRDGNADNAVYSGIDTSWQHGETVETPANSGYRLPSSDEWQFAARYIGTTAPGAGNLSAEYVAQNRNGGSSSLTADYCWTPGDYASGAAADYTDATATGLVSWYSGNSGGSGKPVKGKVPNGLGICDMSGNVQEWCSTIYDTSFRMKRGGFYSAAASSMRVGVDSTYGFPYDEFAYLGFRSAKTK